MVRVLIVDDSAFMRNVLSSMLSSAHEISIVGTARDGQEAIEKVEKLRPDVVTMDVEMPRMDGITALRHIMDRTPVPVIMVSSLTGEGAKVTLDALDLGAADFIPKNLAEHPVNIVRIRESLLDKVRQIGMKGRVMPGFRGDRPVRPLISSKMPPRVKKTVGRNIWIVAIGSSTGGPRALLEIIPRLPGDFPCPIVIAQHMPPNFTGPFAQRLDQVSNIKVKEAEEGEGLKPGVAMVAPGSGHMRVKRVNGKTLVSISENKEDFIYRPSVNALMSSVAEIFPGRALGVILTGMGNDGLKGLIKLKNTGGRILAQDEESCIVYGMPKAVVNAGIADEVLAIEAIADEIVNSAWSYPVPDYS